MKPKVIHKVFMAQVTRAADGDLEFVLSDDTKDRLGDVINPKGWVLDNFKKNPIALFNHISSFPIGTWTSVRVKANRLIGKLKLAALGTSERIDELIRLVDQGIIKAVSVGFMPLDMEPLADNSGILFKEQELLECSLVTVPANPSAIQLARSLKTSDETMALVFGEQASKTKSGSGDGIKTGEQAGTMTANEMRHCRGLPSLPKVTNMETLSKRIESARERLNALKDQLTKHLETLGDEPDDSATEITKELSSKIEVHQKSLDTLVEAEQRLGVQSEEIDQSQQQQTSVPVISKNQKPFAVAAQKVKPSDYVMRSLVAVVLGHIQKRSPREVLIERYGQDSKIDEVSKAVFSFVTRAASAPADTTTSGWASQLVETSVADFMQLLMPASVYPGLSAKGLRLNFGRSGIISIPARLATPTIAGSFVAQGSPIPVRQGAFTAITLTPKKMAVISTFTREIAEHSTPAIEGLIRNAIQEDTSVSLDTILLDAVAASAVRPAGLRNGVTVTTATAGGGFAALVGDLKALIGALITASNGNIRSPVWIMNPIQALAISVTQNAGGDFPFASEINQGRFQGYPLILSSTVTAGMVLLVDAADFVSVEGDAPRFDMSDQATLHMEDTTPLAIGTAGSPNTVAAPVRSLYQTDSLALRMIMDVNWAMRRTGVVAWTQAVTW